MSEELALEAADLARSMIESERPPRGKSELAELIGGFDWESTSLGAQEAWPKSLRTAVGIMLTSRQPIWIGWGPDLVYLYNDPYKSIIGGKHPAALGKPAAVVWREIWQDIGPMLSQAMGGDEGTYVEAQLLIMERNGYPEETYYTFSYSPIPADDGTVGGIFCANSDDTQRVIGERQLALLRELAATTAQARTWEQACERSILALATDPRDLPFAMIYMLDPDGRTATLASATGIDLDHPAVVGAHAAPRRQSVAIRRGIKEPPAADRLRAGNGIPGKFSERSLATAAKQARWCCQSCRAEKPAARVFLSPASTHSGCLTTTIPDFMKLVAGQIAAAIANAEAYEQERRRAEALAELDHAKTAFFSNVSHEFRTPLTLMLGPLEDALSHAEELPPQRREEVTVAHRNALRLLRLVNTLLDFSRVEAGRIEVHFEKTDLCVLTRDIASNFYSVCERANLTLLVDCDPRLPAVYVDRQMWEKIVLNLLSNAFKFTFAGGIEVLLRDAGESAELTVRDTGVGIPASELPHVFERFHRVEGQRGRTHEGSGIGLALVRELVTLHDGTVRVDSVVGRGTAFTVALPYRKGATKADETTSREPADLARATAFVEEALRWLPQDGQPGQYATTLLQAAKQNALFDTAGCDAAAGSRPRVLVADDNADMRDYLRRLLVPHFDVETVSNGVEALQAIRRTKPDLLLSDVMMPGTDGFALLHAIRTDAALSGLPVILLSARAGDEAKVEGLNAGADDYLIKPFGARELLARVNTNIAMARLRREIAAEVEMQRTQLQTVLDTVPVAVWFTYDAEAKHTTGNRCACELLRVPEPANASLSAASERDSAALPYLQGRHRTSRRHAAAAKSGARRNRSRRRDRDSLYRRLSGRDPGASKPLARSVRQSGRRRMRGARYQRAKAHRGSPDAVAQRVEPPRQEYACDRAVDRGAILPRLEIDRKWTRIVRSSSDGSIACP